LAQAQFQTRQDFREKITQWKQPSPTEDHLHEGTVQQFSETGEVSISELDEASCSDTTTMATNCSAHDLKCSEASPEETILQADGYDGGAAGVLLDKEDPETYAQVE
jgi:hypothetical protein